MSSDVQNATIFSQVTPQVPKINAYDPAERTDGSSPHEEIKSVKPTGLKFNKRFKESTESVQVDNVDQTPRFGKGPEEAKKPKMRTKAPAFHPLE